ncbi:ilv operon leader peptide [Candidatus Fukatsuia symbiotica]|nr:ilv operon leader peptide [Candidatus Fukatsuia symbiotica]MEA9445188.1 ilv operon leader peptide [Candidatus Fukatsuia symbiotica]
MKTTFQVINLLLISVVVILIPPCGVAFGRRRA